MSGYKNIFSYNVDINKNAYLNWRVDKDAPQRNLAQLADGYALAAKKLLEDVLKDNHAKDADILIFPILYSVDQMIELYLKAIICEIEILSEGKANSYKTHDIKSLLDTMIAKVKKRESKTAGLNKHLAEVKNYIDELYSYIKETDANGKTKINIDFARYPFDTDLSPHFYAAAADNVVVNLELLLEQLNAVCESLESLYFMYEEEIAAENENYD